MINEKKLIEELTSLLTNSEMMGYLSAFDVVQDCIEIVEKQPKTDWIPCEVEMPKEHESMFAKFKGTNRWSGGMFEKTSDEVNVTIELDDGSIITRTTHTIDGKWSVEINSWVKQKVIAWQPLPAPYKKEGAE